MSGDLDADVAARRHARLSDLVVRAPAGAGAERDAFLSAECAGDKALRAEVESYLIELDETSCSSMPEVGVELGRLAADLLSPDRQHDDSAARPGLVVGPYELQHRIGAGGMGEVWLAEQSAPVERRVALKFIKAGMDTEHVLARFSAERQALAIMDHPAVARIFEAGSTPGGRPYFVMEYVEGVPVTQYCDDQRLAIPERLALFREICEGVQHAHHKGVIHRDLKPSNVLVTVLDGKAVPRIIDFGLAKSLERRLTEHTLNTELGVPIGTPEYMSPEQVRSSDQGVDTRTDVYSLGVILYELLAGARPFELEELRGGGREELFRRLRELEPPTPSTRVSRLGTRSRDSAERRRLMPAALRRQLRGELDWIVMKALEKDLARRYGSPAELAGDLARYERHEPVLAGPPSASYRMRKFARRHRVAVAASAAALVVLVGFAAAMTVQSSRVAAERDNVGREKAVADEVTKVIADALGEIDPQSFAAALAKEQELRIEEAARLGDRSPDEVAAMVAAWERQAVTIDGTSIARKLLDQQVLARFARKLEGEDPRVAARLEDTLGRVYEQIGMAAEAERHARRAVEQFSRALGSEHRETLAASSNLADQELANADAEQLIRATRSAQERIFGAEDRDTLHSSVVLASKLISQRQLEAAEALLRSTTAIQERVLGKEHAETLGGRQRLGLLLTVSARHAEAEAVNRDLFETARRVLGEGSHLTLSALGNLSWNVEQLRGPGAGEELYRLRLELCRRALGDDHPRTLISMGRLADNRLSEDYPLEAEQLYRALYEKSRRALGERHPAALKPPRGWGDALGKLGCFTEMIALRREWLRISCETGEGSDACYEARVELGDALVKTGELDEAAALIETAHEGLRILHPPDEIANTDYVPGSGPLVAASNTLAHLYAVRGDSGWPYPAFAGGGEACAVGPGSAAEFPTGPPVDKRPFGPPTGTAVPYAAAANLAYPGNGCARPAVAASVIPGYPTLHAAVFVNDGHYGHASTWKPATARSWVKIDLGRETVIEQITFGRDRTGAYHDGTSARVQLAVASGDAVYADGNDSADDCEYKAVCDSTRTAASWNLASGATYAMTFPPVRARYVKLTCGDCNFFDEIEVFGQAVEPGTPCRY